MSSSKHHHYLTWLYWSLLSTAMLFIWPSFKFGTAIWNQPPAQYVPHLLLTGIHLGIALLLGLRLWRQSAIRWQEPVQLGLALFGLVALGLFLLRSPFSRFVLPVSILISLLLLIVGTFLIRLNTRKGRVGIVSLVSVLVLSSILLVILNTGSILENSSGVVRTSTAHIRSKIGSGPEKEILDTAFYRLDATTFSNPIESPLLPGGGLALWDEQLLLATGEGYLYLLDFESQKGELKTRKLNVKVPSNYYDFINEAPPSAQKFHFWFRVADVYARTEGDRFEIYSTYHHWKSQSGRYVVRLARLKGLKEELLSRNPNLEWEVLYESSPDLEIKTNIRSGLDFAGLQIGGRIQELDKERLLFTIGDHEHDGWNFEENHPQDPEASYGKVIELNLNTGESEIYSIGHRNPQGLYVDKESNIWSTEHGPQGGGEINLIRKGANYGWPQVTFGTEYGMKEWPLSEAQSDHTGYEHPVYAFATSIALSGIIRLESNHFPIWQGDLILPTLVAESLYRVKLQDHRAISIETLNIGSRIRDLIEDATGQLVLWTDKGTIIRIGQSQEAMIQVPPVLASCLACHSFNPGEPHRIGPNLYGLMDRAIASAKDFNYSPALLNVSGDWTEELLDAFLKDPQAFAPGTIMGFPGIDNEEQRRKILEFFTSPPTWSKP